MIIDIHTHIFPKAIRQNRAAYLPDEPAFALLYASDKSKMVGASALVQTMDEQGVDVSVVFGFPWKNPETAKQHNDYVLDAVSRYPDRLKGFCCVYPFSSGADAEVARCLEDGLSGVGELAFYESGIDDDALRHLAPIMASAKEKQCPVMVHTNEPVGHIYPGKTPNTLKQIYDMVAAFPENKIILAHWGGGLVFYGLLKKQVREVFKHVYFDTAASPFLYHADMSAVAGQCAGFEKILFGSDYPLISPKRYFNEISAVGLSDPQMADICGGNARRLLNIPEPGK